MVLLALFICVFQSGLEVEMKTFLLVTRSNMYQFLDATVMPT